MIDEQTKAKPPIQPFLHDVRTGPCECGAWHTEQDIGDPNGLDIVAPKIGDQK